MREADFLRRISERLGRPQPTVPPHRMEIGAPDFWRNPAAHAYAPAERFARELEQVGGMAVSCSSLADLRTKLHDLLAQWQPRRIGTWGGNFVQEMGLNSVLAPYEWIRWGDGGTDAFAHVDVAITGCAFAVAGTGTIVMESSPERGRSVAVLPPVHVVLLRTSQLRHRMGEVLEELAQRKPVLPASIHFITGPSRSSDIENDQTIGVHGPAAVYVLIWPDGAGQP
ncbi:MAG: lactate utilization protein C [Alicyclobacillus sp.]|nr:lactate utilization protein C [Alicyclobacillus sp.]